LTKYKPTATKVNKHTGKIIAIAAVAASAFVLFSASGITGNLQQPFDSMTGMMEGERMQMQAPEDVIIFFQSEAEVPAGKQTEVVLKVIDKQTNATMQGAQVTIGIEKGLPMTTMDMMSGGMFNAEEKGNGTYAFTFTPDSKGYYTIHTHVIPPGEQMHSMMENHADFVIIPQ
jgi:hypothetical protein